MGRSGFKHQCNQVFGPVLGAQAFEVVHCTFDWLPIAAVVAGRILVVHGGIGDGQWALEDLEGINRPMRDENEPENALAKMVLWSDPTDGDETMQRCGWCRVFCTSCVALSCFVSFLWYLYEIINTHLCEGCMGLFRENTYLPT